MQALRPPASLSADRSSPYVWNPSMTRSIRIVGAIALAATAACSTDPISPSNIAPAIHTANASQGSTRNIVVTESDIARQQEDLPPTRNWVFYYRIVATSTG